MHRSLIIDNSRIELEETDSTNAYLSQLIRDRPIAEGTVVVAHHQTSGRGQKGTQWYSTPNESLTFSLYLKPYFLPIDKQFLLNIAICNGISTCLKQYISHVKIKWPNDIFIDNKKCGGVLIENTISNGKLASSVIGLGLNLNQKTFPENLPHATSISMHTNRTYPIDTFLTNLCKYLDYSYRQLQEGKWEVLKETYLHNLLGIGCPQRFFDAIGVFTGIILGITPAGELIVQKGEKEVHYALKEIQFIF
ncbi:MAG: biotin--[acetyl-CoA-carboxylase] ligase [Flavobacteriales bacterium]|nr:biotin--[acetyl-CoA-carboxylase] ligase [Flavobacteriales bacterium]